MRKPFNAWKEGAKYYGPVLAAGVLLAAALYPYGHGWAGAPVVLAGLAMMLFFRDFPRKITAGPDEVVSPADGRVVAIEELEASPHYDGPCKRISIFLSVFNAHVNRAPFDAAVREITYKPGLFKVAMRADTSDLNESNTLRLDTAAGPMTVRQITGAVARRIVCPVAPGGALAKGEKFGMIRFGSRTELYLPPHAEIHVTINARVKAGTSIVARMP